MGDKTINIIYGKEKRTLVNKIKKICFNNNGTIFGGLVRDEIIASYYREEFINKKLDFSNYWNKNYDTDTIGRLIIPNDIDVYFKNHNNINTFINDIKSYIQIFNGFVRIQHMNNSSNLRKFNYSLNLQLNHTKLYIIIHLGKTISYSGICLKIEVDIISIVNNTLTNIEPPFYNLDFLCNLFIMEKNNGIINIRPSNCTGTPLDNMNSVSKYKNSSKILEDIIKFKTQFHGNNLSHSFDSEYINCYRIIKMIDRDFSWNITNIPFYHITINEDNDNNCCICLQNIYKEQSLISININEKVNNVLHKKCFIQYLKMEQQNKYRNNDNYIEIRCPFRNHFNFKECFKKINFI